MNPNIKLLAWDGILVYMYEAHSPQKNSIPELRKEAILLPPAILDPFCWRQGYLETTGNRGLSPDDILPSHCFRRVAKKCYVNEFGEVLGHPTEPCGIYGLTPFRGLDDLVSKALKIPLAPV